MIQKTIGVASLILMIAALYLIFMYVGVDAAQGDPYRIFYFHVPLNIMGYLSGILLGAASIAFLSSSAPKWDSYGAVAAELGFLTAGAGLMSGMMWAKPIWGAYWVWWDVRLNLQLILVLLFAAYLMLRAYLPPGEKRATLSCVFGILAMIDVPFNYLVLYFVPTKQHPGAVVSPGGGGVDSDMAITFMVSLTAWCMFYAWLFGRRSALARLEDEVDHLEQLVQQS